MSRASEIEQDFTDRVEILTSRVISTYACPQQRLTFDGLGIAGEVGEVVDIIKKYTTYPGELLDKEALILELGDVEFHLHNIRKVLGVGRLDILKASSEKMGRRINNIKEGIK